MKRKAITAVAAVGAFAAPLQMMGIGFNDTLLAASEVVASAAMALIIGKWVAQS